MVFVNKSKVLETRPAAASTWSTAAGRWKRRPTAARRWRWRPTAAKAWSTAARRWSNPAQHERNRWFLHLVHVLSRSAGGAKLPSMREVSGCRKPHVPGFGPFEKSQHMAPTRVLAVYRYFQGPRFVNVVELGFVNVGDLGLGKFPTCSKKMEVESNCSKHMVHCSKK